MPLFSIIKYFVATIWSKGIKYFCTTSFVYIIIPAATALEQCHPIELHPPFLLLSPSVGRRWRALPTTEIQPWPSFLPPPPSTPTNSSLEGTRESTSSIYYILDPLPVCQWSALLATVYPPFSSFHSGQHLLGERAQKHELRLCLVTPSSFSHICHLSLPISPLLVTVAAVASLPAPRHGGARADLGRPPSACVAAEFDVGAGSGPVAGRATPHLVLLRR
jgi:hypothetical protein